MARKLKPVSTMTTQPVQTEDAPAVVWDHEKIAALAYLHWQSRGCPLGSPEEDWLTAERELQESGAAYASK